MFLIISGSCCPYVDSIGTQLSCSRYRDNVLYGHNTKTQDVDTLNGSEKINEGVSLLGKCVGVAVNELFPRVWAFQENGSTWIK